MLVQFGRGCGNAGSGKRRDDEKRATRNERTRRVTRRVTRRRITAELNDVPNTTASSVVDAIGDTPLVELSRLTRGLDGPILAKLEYLNPGFSKKDRIARQIIEDAEADGCCGRADGRRADQRQHRHRPGDRVRRQGLSVRGGDVAGQLDRAGAHDGALGAEVVLVDQSPGSAAARCRAATWRWSSRRRSGSCERGAFRADQFHLPGNFRAHYLHTGPEILRAGRRPHRRLLRLRRHRRLVRRLRGAFKEHDPAIAATSSSRRGRRCWRASR